MKELEKMDIKMREFVDTGAEIKAHNDVLVDLCNQLARGDTVRPGIFVLILNIAYVHSFSERCGGPICYRCRENAGGMGKQDDETEINQQE